MAKMTKEIMAAKLAAMEALKELPKKGWLERAIEEKNQKNTKKSELPIRLEKAEYKNAFWG